jgi:hypothetical protein
MGLRCSPGPPADRTEPHAGRPARPARPSVHGRSRAYGWPRETVAGETLRRSTGAAVASTAPFRGRRAVSGAVELPSSRAARRAGSVPSVCLGPACGRCAQASSGGRGRSARWGHARHRRSTGRLGTGRQLDRSRARPRLGVSRARVARPGAVRWACPRPTRAVRGVPAGRPCTAARGAAREVPGGAPGSGRLARAVPEPPVRSPPDRCPDRLGRASPRTARAGLHPPTAVTLPLLTHPLLTHPQKEAAPS